jgi:hypothetical protein
MLSQNALSGGAERFCRRRPCNSKCSLAEGLCGITTSHRDSEVLGEWRSAPMAVLAWIAAMVRARSGLGREAPLPQECLREEHGACRTAAVAPAEQGDDLGLPLADRRVQRWVANPGRRFQPIADDAEARAAALRFGEDVARAHHSSMTSEASNSARFTVSLCASSAGHKVSSRPFRLMISA